MKLLVLPLFFLAAIASDAQGASRPVVPPVTPGMRHNDDFTVRIREPGGRWQDLFEHEVVVDLDAPQKASMAMFDMDGPVEVEVRRNNGNVRDVHVRPLRAGVSASLEGSVARFVLRRPANLSIEFDGDRLHNLHLFAGPMTPPPPSRGDPDVIWFGPGVHVPPDQPGSVFSFPSGKTVYLEAGAILKGKIVLDRVSNVRILGRGIIDQPERGFEITRSSHITIDGPVVINPRHYTLYCGQSDHIAVHDLKTFSAAPWSDGLDFMSCSDVSVRNVFLRTSDDSIAIYGARWDFRGDARNFDVRDAVLWADVAHPINIGLHGAGATRPETIENLAFDRIDVLGHDEDDPDYQGVMAVSEGDDNLVRHVSFNDIAVEDVEEGSLLNFRVLFNKKYSLSPGRGIQDVRLTDIRVSEAHLRPSVIAGYATNRSVQRVTISGLKVAGKAVTDLRSGDIDVGPFASGVTLLP